MKEKLPKICLLIYTYNRSQIVEKAINSILTQTYKDFELVLINNGSTDNTREVLEKYASLPNVRIIHLEKNRGSAGGHNYALSQIRGEWFGIIGDDDYLLPEAFETMMKVPEEIDPEITAVTCNTKSTTDGSFAGKGLDKDQYLPLEKIITKTSGDFFALTKSDLVGDKRLNEALTGDANTLWYQIDAIANRYYIHQALMVFNTIPGNTETTAHTSINTNVRTIRYKELVKEDFYWQVLLKYNKKGYLSRCLRGMYFMKIAREKEILHKYHLMLLRAQPTFKQRVFSRIILGIRPQILKTLYQLAGKNVVTELAFRLFVKRQSLIGQ